MDNQNDPNSSNNNSVPPSPFPDLSSLPQSIPTTPEPALPVAEPTATPQPDPATNGSTPSWSPASASLPESSPAPAFPNWPSPTPQSPAPSNWPSDPVQPNPVPVSSDTTGVPAFPQTTEPSAWPAPSAVTEPLAPASEAIVPQNPTSSWTPPVESAPQPNADPVQSPSVDQDATTAQPSWAGIPVNPAEPQMNAAPVAPMEAAPTDLSHLINNNPSGPTNPPTSEAVVVPPITNISPQVPNLPAQTHNGGIPKWLIGLGAGLLLLVIGASAYFILGVGQPNKTTSLPVETTSKTAEVKTPPPIVTPTAVPTAQPASGSANFGQLGGNTNTPQTIQATSAADLLRQRQQGI